MIDFGYARKFLEIEQIKTDKGNENKIFYKHYTNCLENKWAGTCNFMSIAISDGYRPSRRMDIQELIYTLFFLIKRDLPWSSVRAKNHIEKCKKMGDIKK